MPSGVFVLPAFVMRWVVNKRLGVSREAVWVSCGLRLKWMQQGKMVVVCANCCVCKQRVKKERGFWKPKCLWLLEELWYVVVGCCALRIMIVIRMLFRNLCIIFFLVLLGTACKNSLDDWNRSSFHLLTYRKRSLNALSGCLSKSWEIVKSEVETIAYECEPSSCNIEIGQSWRYRWKQLMMLEPTWRDCAKIPWGHAMDEGQMTKSSSCDCFDTAYEFRMHRS